MSANEHLILFLLGAFANIVFGIALMLGTHDLENPDEKNN